MAQFSTHLFPGVLQPRSKWSLTDGQFETHLFPGALQPGWAAFGSNGGGSGRPYDLDQLLDLTTIRM